MEHFNAEAFASGAACAARLKPELTQERLKQLLHYDPETGVFVWNVTTSTKAKSGNIAGVLNGNGYRQIKVDKHLVTASRLAWLYIYGCFPDCFVDHKNGDRADNRICNLRLCTNQQNQGNSKLSSRNTSGVRGVTWDKKRMKWRVSIGQGISGKPKYLGMTRNIEDARQMYLSAAEALFGEFAAHLRDYVSVTMPEVAA